MYLDLNNVLYYLLENHYINEDEVFEGKFNTYPQVSLNSVFLVKNQERLIVVKQSYNNGKEKEIALKKDAYFMNQIYQTEFFINDSETAELIDKEKLIFVRKGVLNSENIHKSIEKESFNNGKILLEKIHEIHNVINGKNFINNTVNSFSIEDESLLFSRNLPFVYPKSNLEYDDLQVFWKKVNPEIIAFVIECNQKLIKCKTLIHGDLSLKNILFDTDKKNFYLIDWEMCRYGELIWDYASLYSEKLFFNSDKIPYFFDQVEKYVNDNFSKKEFVKFKKYAILTQIKRLNQLLQLNKVSRDHALSKLDILNSNFKDLINGKL